MRKGVICLLIGIVALVGATYAVKSIKHVGQGEVGVVWCVMARLTPEQVQQMNTLRGALMDAILAENASREAKNNEGRTEL